jgi:hypothetical protein
VFHAANVEPFFRLANRTKLAMNDEKLNRAIDDIKKKRHIKALLTMHPRRFMRRYDLSKDEMLVILMTEQLLSADFNGVISIDPSIFEE